MRGGLAPLRPATWVRHFAAPGLCSACGRLGSTDGVRDLVPVLSGARRPVRGLKAGLLRRQVRLQGALVPALAARLTASRVGTHTESVNRASLIAVFAFSLIALSTLVVV